MIPEALRQNYYRALAVSKIKNNEFTGSSPPGIFVSHFNYPKIPVSIVSLTEQNENAYFYDSPELWFNKPQEEILAMRHELIYASKTHDKGEPQNPSRELLDMQELALSKNFQDLDVSLKKMPEADLSFCDVLAPIGPKAQLEKFSFTDNPKIFQKAERIFYDTDAKSVVAIKELYSDSIPISSIYKLLSIGALGQQKRRILVPTKWAITAIDDTVSKQLIEEIKMHQQINEYQLFLSSYLDNYFYILLIPNCWSFEMLESWLGYTEKGGLPGIAVDYELYAGRKKYADQITGAYYSARLAVAEYLKKIRRQASAIVFREISPEYKIPMGVWQIRENVRFALSQKPISFSSLDLALDFISTKLKNPMKYYKNKSVLINELKTQRRISEFF
ncbi:MAG: hypothetical protein COT15_00500 [Candidatus Diapherotrites archaeon CG08_land_8_20_14_0_20_34_12]|nr:MAG: hypothetical protein COT15_00500 [Candidatus Diapherotrites archaeon CG08_land_8_20_14_0_20_34_12]